MGIDRRRVGVWGLLLLLLLVLLVVNPGDGASAKSLMKAAGSGGSALFTARGGATAGAKVCMWMWNRDGSESKR